MKRSIASLLQGRQPGSSRLVYRPISSPLSKYNSGLQRCAEKGDLFGAMRLAQQLRVNMKITGIEEEEEEDGGGGGASEGLRPDVVTYEALAKNFAVHGLHQESLRLIDDARAVGVEPDVDVWNQVLRAHVLADVSPSAVLEAMTEARIAPNALTRHLIVLRLVKQRNLEEALRVLYSPALLAGQPVQPASANKRPFADVTLQTIVAVVQLAASLGETSLGLDLATQFEKNSGRRCPDSVYLALAQNAVTEDDLDTAVAAYERLVRMGIELDEGLAVSLLNTFSRHGAISLCEDVLTKQIAPILHGEPLKEWHIAPLVTAYTTSGRLEAAIAAFDGLRDSLPSTSTKAADPSYHMFLAGLKTVDAVQRALEYVRTLLQDKVAGVEGPRISIQLVNAVLKASDDLGMYDVHRTLSDLLLSDELQPEHLEVDVETFNILLSRYRGHKVYDPSGQLIARGSFTAQNEVERIISVLKTKYKDIKPNYKTYETLSLLHLASKTDNWEVAFDYLEEMKHFDFLPSGQLYCAFLNKLVDEGEAKARQLEPDLAVEASIDEQSEPTSQNPSIDGNEPLPYDSSREQPSTVAGKDAEDSPLPAIAIDDPRIDLLLQEMAALGYLGGGHLGIPRRNMLSADLRQKIGSDRILRAREGLFRGDARGRNRRWQ